MTKSIVFAKLIYPWGAPLGNTKAGAPATEDFMSMKPEEHQAIIAEVFGIKKPRKSGNFKPLIEAYAEMLKRHADDITMGPLGKVLMQERGTSRNLFMIKPTVVHSEIEKVIVSSLTNQGIFGIKNPMNDVPFDKKGVIKIWGFLREGVWIYAEMGFKKARAPLLGWKAVYDNELRVYDTELAKLLSIFGNTIFFELGDFIKEINKKHEERGAWIANMRDIVNFTEMLVKIGK
ncbi:MAG: hypothetical protein ACD_8C00098G0003 [uncultured bacterium]|nr:MAG: hypothetical protein ACD_8C00098G0003 [uncultured bacterium]